MRGNPIGIFLIFLRLGLTSFGGPVAHLGYFRNEFVTKRGWISESAYADIVALSQFVPGPASSQTGFALGLLRGGVPGGLAAWLGFTLPSAVIMLGAAYGVSFASTPEAAGVIHGLKLLAIAIVAQAVWSMGKSLCPDRARAGFAMAVAALLLVFNQSGAQLAVIAAGALFGLALLRGHAAHTLPAISLSISKPLAIFSIILFFVLLIAGPLLAKAGANGLVSVANAFYRAGALVFGGGHVVLPLLEERVVQPGWVSSSDFLAGYGIAQAVPGPLFTFAAFLGAKATVSGGGAVSAIVALCFIFLPGLLLILGLLPFWNGLRSNLWARAALDGVNAAVVGLLTAALYSAVWLPTVKTNADAAIAIVLFAALTAIRLPVLAVVGISMMIGLALAQL